jgi:Phage-related minor tail protein.
MQTPQAEIDRLGSSLVALGNNSATTEREILDMATRIASAGAQIGLTEGEVLGFAAALSSVGIEAEAGGTAISKVMIQTRNAVMDGGEALETFAMVAGMSADQFKTKFEQDAGGAIIDFIEGLARLESQGVNTNTILAELGFADVRVGNALRSAASAGDLFREASSWATRPGRRTPPSPTRPPSATTPLLLSSGFCGITSSSLPSRSVMCCSRF